MGLCCICKSTCNCHDFHLAMFQTQWSSSIRQCSKDSILNCGLRIQVFWDMNVCCWLSTSQRFECTMILQNYGNHSANDTASLPRRHFQQHSCENLKSCTMRNFITFTLHKTLLGWLRYGLEKYCWKTWRLSSYFGHLCLDNE